jgi:DNA-binding PadR family transcriptional regulator
MSKRTAGLSLGEYAVLGVLRERPMHGYEIARRFAADLDLGLVLPMDMSSVYAMLKELHEHGLIEGEHEMVGRHRLRMVYHLTPEAEALLLNWLAEPVHRLREVRADLLIKLYFCHAVGLACTRRLLEAQIAACHGYLARAEQLAADSSADDFERLVRASKLSAARATLDWLDDERLRLVAEHPRRLAQIEG